MIYHLPREMAHGFWYFVQTRKKLSLPPKRPNYDQYIHYMSCYVYDKSYGKFADKYEVRDYFKLYRSEQFKLPSQREVFCTLKMIKLSHQKREVMIMKSKKGFIGITFFLVLVIAFSVAGTVYSRDDKGHKIESEYYYELEQTYVEEMKAVLVEEGFLNSGVMLLRTVNEDGSRQYRINIHNSRFERLSEEEREALINELRKKEFTDANCSFTHSLS